MGSMSRRKGKVGERECAAEMGELLGVEARRGVQFQGGPDSPDVVLPGVNLHVECKRVERLKLWDAIDQAKADAPAGGRGLEGVPLIGADQSRSGMASTGSALRSMPFSKPAAAARARPACQRWPTRKKKARTNWVAESH